MINGETVQIRRDRPCLTPDAIRTVFPNVPSYLTKKLPPKRKTAASNGCLSFQTLARSPSRGNVSEGLLNSLLGPSNSCDLKFVQNKLDDLLDVWQLNEVHEMLNACDALPDHRDLVGEKSDSRVTYYVCGYVARRMLKKTKCGDCAELLLQGVSQGPRPR